jgi:hypothetical protein
MPRLIKTITTLAVLALAFALPAAAGAAPHVKRPSADVAYSFKLQGSKGFTIEVFGDSRTASIVADKTEGKRLSSSVSYSFHPKMKFDGTTLSLKVPGLAGFQARFVPGKTRQEKPESPCTGEPTVVEEGSFAGSFSFHGERGYATAAAKRATGEVIRIAAQTCRFPAEKNVHHESPAEEAKSEEAAHERIVQLIAERPDTGLTVVAERTDIGTSAKPFSETIVLVNEIAKAHGIVSSHNLILTSLPGRVLQVPVKSTKPPAEANLAPPSPFSGTSTFTRRSGKKPSWTGNLTVELPGLGRLPLSGPKFRTQLCEGSSCRGS